MYSLFDIQSLASVGPKRQAHPQKGTAGLSQRRSLSPWHFGSGTWSQLAANPQAPCPQPSFLGLLSLGLAFPRNLNVSHQRHVPTLAGFSLTTEPTKCTSLEVQVKDHHFSLGLRSSTGKILKHTIIDQSF